MKRWFSRGTWEYGVLLIVLFGIASLAAWTTIDYLDGQLPHLVQFDELRRGMMFSIWALTMGFMLIAGAFGLWAIQFAGTAESYRRIGRVVDAMDYLSDGLLSLDRRGRITGSNPAARGMFPFPIATDAPLQSVFPWLSDEEVVLLLDASQPNELQRDIPCGETFKTVRFRSQPSAGVVLLLLSDITAMRAKELRRQYVERLQLIGRMAKGVAHDFNNIFCAISTHVSLVERFGAASDEGVSSLAALRQETDKGIALADHVLQLSQSGVADQPTERLGAHVERAAELLRVGLAAGWKVDVECEEGEFPTVALSGIQLEQLVVNLGLRAAEAVMRPGAMRISVHRPGRGHLLDVGARYGAVVILSVNVDGERIRQEEVQTQPSPEGHEGIIHSVARSLLEEAGGALDYLWGPDNARIFRILLPHSRLLPSRSGFSPADAGLPAEFETYIRRWRVLLAEQDRSGGARALEGRLYELGASVERAETIIATLARVEDGQRQFDVLVVDEALLATELHGLLRAMGKLCPGTGIVVLSEEPGGQPEALAEDVVFADRRSTVSDILRAMIEARGQAARRQGQG